MGRGEERGGMGKGGRRAVGWAGEPGGGENGGGGAVEGLEFGRALVCGGWSCGERVQSGEGVVAMLERRLVAGLQCRS